jgi:hypothetical protein
VSAREPAGRVRASAFEAFARRCEREHSGSCELDADFFELAGYRVARAPRWKLWGADTSRWLALPRVSFDVDDVLLTIEVELPGWTYSVDGTAPETGIKVALYSPRGPIVVWAYKANARTLPLAFLAAAARAVDAASRQPARPERNA